MTRETQVDHEKLTWLAFFRLGAANPDLLEAIPLADQWIYSPGPESGFGVLIAPGVDQYTSWAFAVERIFFGYKFSLRVAFRRQKASRFASSSALVASGRYSTQEIRIQPISQEYEAGTVLTFPFGGRME